jgi:cation diffusion facilitator CzcD-associated flavoprotein CzcO
VNTCPDVVVVGAGFAGLYALHRLRSDGFSVRVVEAGGDVGGTWYWNRYPGARCDVESLDYSYSFSRDLEQEWDWTERYATQPEILSYIEHVTERFDLRRDITFGTTVDSAVLDEAELTWTVTTSAGESINARFLVLATGPLSVANLPAVPGLTDFGGRVLHTGAWPHHPIDFTGRRVAVMGTGSSGIQLIPLVAQQSAHLHVLQRTPNFTIPAANWRWDPDDLKLAKSEYDTRRYRSWRNPAGTPQSPSQIRVGEVDAAEQDRRFEEEWQAGGARWLRTTFADVVTDRDANKVAAEWIRRKIRTTVKDPAVAERLTPRDYPLGAKRICVDTDYWQTFNRPNVTLVELHEDPVERIEATGVRLAGGLIELDDLIFATGFDAMTGAVLRLDLRGRGGQQLRSAWTSGPRSYLGLAVAGFPNLFILNGPGSPSVLSNMVLTSEQQVNWLGDALAHVRRNDLVGLEATEAAEERWGEHCAALSAGSFLHEVDSWYVGANIPGKPRVLLPYVGGLAKYGEECRQVADAGYRGFTGLHADH